MITPTPKTAPTRDGTKTSKRIGSVYKDAYPIFVHEPVLDEILAYSEEDKTREIGGLLVGGLHEDKREYVEIRGFVPAVGARSGVASLTFTHETWATLTRKIEAEHPGEHVVGWHHTHPNFGIFLSAYDEFIHKNFFGEPWQIAMVVDPVASEFGFFQWRNGEIVLCGFICVSKEKQ